jgi:GNAT superfamily N-acetyltransferase
LRIRLLKSTDLPDLTALSTGAGWNQTADDWRMLLGLAPDTCWGVECEGRLAATTTLLCYGTRLAWIGMVLTSPEFQRRGFARALMTHALEIAGELKIETVKLDATDQGRPIYESLGFVAECAIERWLRGGSHAEDNTARQCALQRVLDIDKGAFPVERGGVLKEMFGRTKGFARGNSYLLCRLGRRASYIGPFICGDPTGADELVSLALSSGGNSFIWDLFPHNQAALELARRHGFTRERALTRMSWGKPLRECVEFVYGIAGFELG